MRTFTRRRALAVLGIGAIGLAACGSSSSSGSSETTAGTSAASAAATSAASALPATGGLKVVASTSWVAAFAKLAGATDVSYIAPNNVQHPPDYDPKPSDLAKVADAQFVLLAGFEGFAQRLKDASGSKAKVEVVATEFDPAKLKAEVMRLAGVLGTDMAAAEKNVAAYAAFYDKAAADLKAKLAGKTPVVVAQAFVANWVVFAGFTPAGTYGPMPPTASQVSELTSLKPTYVFENVHMGGGTEIAAAANAKKIDLVNFPGDDLDLTKVVAKDAELIAAAFA